jgi:serine/threonine-protein kinase
VLTGNQMGVGSPGYMAPEQVEGGRQIDARCDIWALGVVMYELLAQQPAFSGETPHSLCLQILAAPIKPLSELRPELPAALVYVVERCLERDPDRRFANVAELAEALAPLDDASPDSEATRARRRLEAVAPVDEVVVRPTPAGTPVLSARRESASDDQRDTPVLTTGPRRTHHRRRRIVSGVVVTLALAPALALLPAVSTAPELEPARAWSMEARGSAERAWLEARQAWQTFWAEHGAPGQTAPAP